MQQSEREERTFQPSRTGGYVLLALGISAVFGHCEERRRIDWLKPLPVHLVYHGGDALSSVTSKGQEEGILATRLGLGPTKALGFAVTYLGDIGVQKAQGSHHWPVRVYRGLLGAGYGWVIAHNRSIK